MEKIIWGRIYQGTDNRLNDKFNLSRIDQRIDGKITEWDSLEINGSQLIKGRIDLDGDKDKTKLTEFEIELIMQYIHKVLTYIEYRAVSGVFRTIDLPPPLPLASVSSPPTKGGGFTLAGRWGGGGSIVRKTPDIGLASYSIILCTCIIFRDRVTKMIGESGNHRPGIIRETPNKQRWASTLANRSNARHQSS
jgi:hypothetical protein